MRSKDEIKDEYNAGVNNRKMNTHSLFYATMVEIMLDVREVLIENGVKLEAIQQQTDKNSLANMIQSRGL